MRACLGPKLELYSFGSLVDRGRAPGPSQLALRTGVRHIAFLFIADGTYLFVPDNPHYEGSQRLHFVEHDHPVSPRAPACPFEFATLA
jgi:hypothetical protein